MGNRAVITTKDETIGVYLHWNGGYDSVNAFLKYCALQDFRSPSEDLTYGFARLTQVICNFFGGGLSCGVGPLNKLDCDNFDNGVYIIDGWDIVGRKYHDGPEQNEYNLEEMLLDINAHQPENMQLAKEVIIARSQQNGWISPKFKKGEKVLVSSPNQKERTVGFIEDSWEINGQQGYTVKLEDGTYWFFAESQVGKY